MTIQAILGRKLGTTEVVRQTGDIDCVTAIVAGPCTITQLKTKDNDGYSAVQIGFEEAKSVNKPMSGHLSASGNKFKHLAEVRVPNSESIEPETENQLNIGQVIDVNSFTIDSNCMIYSCLKHVMDQDDTTSIDLPIILSAAKEIELRKAKRLRDNLVKKETYIKDVEMSLNKLQDLKNIEGTQKVFNHRAKMCSLASKGEWSEEVDKI